MQCNNCNVTDMICQIQWDKRNCINTILQMQCGNSIVTNEMRSMQHDKCNVVVFLERLYSYFTCQTCLKFFLIVCDGWDFIFSSLPRPISMNFLVEIQHLAKPYKYDQTSPSPFNFLSKAIIIKTWFRPFYLFSLATLLLVVFKLLDALLIKCHLLVAVFN